MELAKSVLGSLAALLLMGAFFYGLFCFIFNPVCKGPPPRIGPRS